MLTEDLKQRIAKLDHEKLIFAGLHRGGSSVFYDVCLHIIKLKSFDSIEGVKNKETLRPTKVNVGANSSMFFNVDRLEKRELEEKERVAFLEERKDFYYLMYRISTDIPLLAMEELVKSPNSKTILLVRDIRDCMCSGYYSFNLLHGQGLKDPGHKKDFESGIDRYVLEKMTPKFQRALEVIETIGKNPNNVIFRYEDMISDPKEFVYKLCELIGLQKDRYEMAWNLVAWRFDYKDISYDMNKHVRQVFPGNFKKELKSSTIASVNNAFQNYLGEYNYL